jgi:hypothetical protein
LQRHKHCGGLDGTVALGDGVVLQGLTTPQQLRTCRRGIMGSLTGSSKHEYKPAAGRVCAKQLVALPSLELWTVH